MGGELHLPADLAAMAQRLIGCEAHTLKLTDDPDMPGWISGLVTEEGDLVAHLDVEVEVKPLEWKGPGKTPHDYVTDLMAMGDCRICGHTYEAHQPKRIATRPASEIAAEVRLPVDRMKEAREDGKGFWKPCCGCHETNEGYPTGQHSDAFGCCLGNGCYECGGLGAVWDTTNYDDMGDSLAQSSAKPDEVARLKAVALCARAVIENADRPGSRACLNCGPDGEDTWIDHQEVDQEILDDLSSALAALADGGTHD